MRVLFAAAEMAPLAKVGGVGDVAGSLPAALRAIGLDVRVALPYYQPISREQFPAQRVASLPDGAIWQTEAAGAPVYLVEHEPSFAREQVYGYKDDPARFLAFADTLLAAAGDLGWQPDVLHLNDWHTGFFATRLAAASEHPWSRAARICTIHNLAYAGTFTVAFAREHAFPTEAFATPSGVPPKLARSALAQAILHADVVSTVSPTYAREILQPELGGDLTPLLRAEGDHVAGILNGIDYTLFDPATDRHLPATFDIDHLDRRAENKRALQQAYGLPIDEVVPVVGMVTRLVVQKGADLAVAAVDRLLSQRSFQLVVLGTGDQPYERALTQLAERHPQQVSVRIAFDVALGQLCYGGSDLFLMPSRYEPCGLGQMIAMRYGSIPVVRRTGGLADSVQPYGPDTGAGFLFDEASPAALAAALDDALTVYEDRPAWRSLQGRAMGQDLSWAHSAREYEALYERAARLRAERSSR